MAKTWVDVLLLTWSAIIGRVTEATVLVGSRVTSSAKTYIVISWLVPSSELRYGIVRAAMSPFDALCAQSPKYSCEVWDVPSVYVTVTGPPALPLPDEPRNPSAV